MNKIFVLLPVFNRWVYTKQCLRSLRNQKYKNFKVVLIDSGSTDKTLDYVKRYYPEVAVITGTTDWWWTRAMFEGVRWVLKRADQKDFVLLMNDDCYFNSDYLSKLLNTAKRCPKTIIGSLCVDANKTNHIAEAGVRINWKEATFCEVASTFLYQLKNLNVGRNKVIDNLDAIPGKGMLIPTAVFRKIGNFNYKKFPHYVADYEFSNRAKRAGFKLVVDPHIIVKNHIEATGDYFRRKVDHPLSFKEAWGLLFSRKSRNNIIDQLNFVWFVFPDEYKLSGTIRVLGKVIIGVGMVYPFCRMVPRYLRDHGHEFVSGKTQKEKVGDN